MAHNAYNFRSLCCYIVLDTRSVSSLDILDIENTDDADSVTVAVSKVLDNFIFELN